MEESVFAISTGDLWALIPYTEKGFVKASHEVLNQIVRKGLFRNRGELEQDPAFKQLIPYAVISHRDCYLLFTRTSGQVEKRLHNKLHLGLGGHMNPCSSGTTDESYPIEELSREFHEEVRLTEGCTIEGIEFIGFINDDTIPVGRVHIGLLYDIHLSGQQVVVNEKDKMTAKWIDRSSFSRYFDEMESWSRIAIDHHINRKEGA